MSAASPTVILPHGFRALNVTPLRVVDLDALLDGLGVLADEPTPIAQNDNPVKNGRPISIVRDAANVLDFQGFAQAHREALGGVRPVCKGGDTPPSLPPPTNPSDLFDELPETIPSSSRQFEPWFRPFLSGPNKRRRPAAFRDLSQPMLAEVAFAGMAERGLVWDFSLNLSASVEAQALAQDDAAGYVAKRIAYHVEVALGRDAAVVFALEDRIAGDGRRLHLHGVVQIDEAEEKHVRRALKRAGGNDYPDDAGNQLVMRPAPNAGWLGYMMKFEHLARPGVREKIGARAPTFKGAALKINAAAKEAGRVVYEAFRVSHSKPKLARKHKSQSNLIDTTQLRSSTYLSAPSNVVTPGASTLFGEKRKCIAFTSWPTTTTPISWRPSAPLRTSSTRSPAPATWTPSFGRSRTSTFFRSGRPPASSRIAPTTATWSTGAPAD